MFVNLFLSILGVGCPEYPWITYPRKPSYKICLVSYSIIPRRLFTDFLTIKIREGKSTYLELSLLRDTSHPYFEFWKTQLKSTTSKSLSTNFCRNKLEFLFKYNPYWIHHLKCFKMDFRSEISNLENSQIWDFALVFLLTSNVRHIDFFWTDFRSEISELGDWVE